MTDPAHVLALHRAGLTARRIAGLAESTTAEVEAVLRRAGLTPRMPPATPKAERTARNPLRAIKPVATKPPARINPVRYALQVLGPRAAETAAGFAVDGRPVGSFELIRKANAVLKAAEQPQMDACEEWLIGD